MFVLLRLTKGDANGSFYFNLHSFSLIPSLNKLPALCEVRKLPWSRCMLYVSMSSDCVFVFSSSFSLYSWLEKARTLLLF